MNGSPATKTRPVAPSLPALRISAAVLIALGLWGCAERQTDWTSIENGAQIHRASAQIDQLRHLVSFGTSGTVATAVEIDRLDAFLTAHQVLPSDRILLVPSLREDLAMADARAMGLATQLRQKGYRVDAPDGHQALAPAPTGNMAVIIRRERVVEPRCPDWSGPYLSSWNNRSSSNLGCANATNLARMIEEPRDLVHGRDLDSMNGFFGSLAVNRYLLGQVLGDPTAAGQGGGGGSSDDSSSGSSGSSGPTGSSASLD